MMEGDRSATEVRSASRRQLARKALLAYLFLVAVGTGALLEFVPEVFSGSELSGVRLFAAALVGFLVMAPIVAIGYMAIEMMVEAALLMTAWLFKAGYRALACRVTRWFSRRGEP
ncbi:hypothetical protein AACH06_21035 [Ideonella sp. DXS29W]|uniref:Uncharacterized protein n=1 Tax=Ideonella lacteola TaxID=2984193 RepID=A0ABU9BXY7_9BURK